MPDPGQRPERPLHGSTPSNARTVRAPGSLRPGAPGLRRHRERCDPCSWTSPASMPVNDAGQALAGAADSREPPWRWVNSDVPSTPADRVVVLRLPPSAPPLLPLHFLRSTAPLRSSSAGLPAGTQAHGDRACPCATAARTDGDPRIIASQGPRLNHICKVLPCTGQSQVGGSGCGHQGHYSAANLLPTGYCAGLGERKEPGTALPLCTQAPGRHLQVYGQGGLEA